MIECLYVWFVKFNMIYHTHSPSAPLGAFIEQFVYYKGYNPEHTVDRFLPDGYIYVVIDLTDYPKYIYDNDSLKEIQSCRNVWFSGIREKYITIPSGRDNEMFIIYFRKGKAYPFVEMPMQELTDVVVDGELVMQNAILEMRDMLLGCANASAMFALADRYLSHAFMGKLVSNPFVDFAVNAILRDPSQASIAAIANKVGYSHKQMIKIFTEHVGLTPKSFLKVIRFQKAVEEIQQQQYSGWASLALDSGYYDQAHFIHDFKSFSGFTPRQFLQLQSAYLNYIAVG